MAHKASALRHDLLRHADEKFPRLTDDIIPLFETVEVVEGFEMADVDVKDGEFFPAGNFFPDGFSARARFLRIYTHCHRYEKRDNRCPTTWAQHSQSTRLSVSGRKTS